MEQEKKFNDKKREWENNDDVVVEGILSLWNVSSKG